MKRGKIKKGKEIERKTYGKREINEKNCMEKCGKFKQKRVKLKNQIN